MGFGAAWTAVPLTLLVAVGSGVQLSIGVVIGFAWAAFIGGVVAAVVMWVRAPDFEMESEFDPAPGDDAEFVRGDRVRHTSGRLGQVVEPGDPGKSRIKWLDTWDVSQANNRDLALEDDNE